MDRVARSVLLRAFGLVLFLASCAPTETKVAVPKAPVPPESSLTSSGFFPALDLEIDGRPVAAWSDWSQAGVYTPDRLSEAQRTWMADLEPAGGEGRLGLGFDEDLDGDGRAEKVTYGAYRKASGEEGNFLLVTRGGEALLLREWPGSPQLTVFTLKSDGSLWFGGGVEAGEVTRRVAWSNHTPVFSNLTEE